MGWRLKLGRFEIQLHIVFRLYFSREESLRHIAMRRLRLRFEDTLNIFVNELSFAAYDGVEIVYILHYHFILYSVKLLYDTMYLSPISGLISFYETK